MKLLILPTQLFNINKNYKQILNNVDEIIIAEHSYYFTRFKFHKLKLAYMVASMRNYKDYIEEYINKNANYRNIKISYITFDKYNNRNFNYKDIRIYDPIDIPVKEEFKNSEILESNMFLLDNKDISCINYKRFNSFYDISKKIIKEKYKLDFTELKSQDKLNRKTMSSKDIQDFKEVIPKYKNKHYKYAIKYINQKFKNNFGELDIDNLSELAVDYKDAKKHLNIFLKKRLNKFGPYQDFVSKNHNVLYHSNISYLINCGLLSPLYVLKEINKYRGNKECSYQSFEGFVRQIIWREFMRYIYVKNPEIKNDNFWKSKNKINWKQMYGEESTGFKILDNEINKLKRTGWNHHIVRLAVFLNYFVLTETDPEEINKWFQEVISLDSYEWVMVSNIWVMGYYTKGYTSKPYYFSSNYLNKMTDYKIESGWDEKYRKFVENKKDFKYYRY